MTADIKHFKTSIYTCNMHMRRACAPKQPGKNIHPPKRPGKKVHPLNGPEKTTPHKNVTPFTLIMTGS